MLLNDFYFQESMWLWGLVFVPVLAIVSVFSSQNNTYAMRIKDFADAHLLPHLLVQNTENGRASTRSMLPLMVLWALIVFAMANPRWNKEEVTVYAPDKSLVIVLDLSNSMNAQDIKPSRLARARQEIEDLLTLGEGIDFGLIVFSSIPHVVTPITDDPDMVAHFLPHLSTKLIYKQGSRLASALLEAERMLKAKAGINKSILVISDGGFKTDEALRAAKKIAEDGISIHVMGVGTLEGAPILDSEGNIIKGRNGEVIISRLERKTLQALAKAGSLIQARSLTQARRGKYLDSHYTDEDSQFIVQRIFSRARAADALPESIEIWNEGFYFFIIPALLMVLFLFRRGCVLFVGVFFYFLSPPQLLANDASFLERIFKNNQQQGRDLMLREAYDQAAELFDDPYKRGVAQYKAGNFHEAEQAFREAELAEVYTDARYNLGNAFAMQGKFQEAVEAYTEVLSREQDHDRARHNLKVVKKMIQNEKSQSPDQSGSEQKTDDSSEEDSAKDSAGNSAENSEGDQSENQKDNAELSENKDNERKRDNQEKSADSSDSNKNSHDKNNSAQQQEKSQKNTLSDDSESDDSESDDAGSDGKQRENQAQSPASTGKESEGDSATEGNVSGKNSDQIKASDSDFERNNIDVEADQWLNHIQNMPEEFLKNQFYIETLNAGVKEEDNLW
jgi:Ca-activated chloride channel family protein